MRDAFPSQYLNLSYEELEEKNTVAKYGCEPGVGEDEQAAHFINYLSMDTQIKAVMLCFSDLQGRLHTLDYDKKHFLHHHRMLLLDGGKILGQRDAQQLYLRLQPDWGSFRWLPADVFGAGKVMIFATMSALDGSAFALDCRTLLYNYVKDLKQKREIDTHISLECEGFLLEGQNAEQNYRDETGFKLVSKGGYFHSLPQDPLRKFVDRLAGVKRALGFENERDQPEVAPSQFELNYRPFHALGAADQLQLYKMLARQTAANMGYTASFLAKPISGINGNGAPCRISLTRKGADLFAGKGSKSNLSAEGEAFCQRVLSSANDLSLVLSPSVNAYRRLDPDFKAPVQIKVTTHEPTSILTIPPVGEGHTVIQVRCIAPDINPYLALYTLLRTGLEGSLTPRSAEVGGRRSRTRCIPDNIHDAIRHFRSSDWMTELLGHELKEEYVTQKQHTAWRSPKSLGSLVKESEVLYHHEITNQFLWSQF
ncbi:MAG: glutamine synthetase [Zetaproteobacteria bacterium]|nr:glutamine synthetase [Zetaproteobacteria bacterium]